MLIKQSCNKIWTEVCRERSEGDVTVRHLLFAVLFFAAVLAPSLIALGRGVRTSAEIAAPPE
jgi:hypothetical protein